MPHGRPLPDLVEGAVVAVCPEPAPQGLQKQLAQAECNSNNTKKTQIIVIKMLLSIVIVACVCCGRSSVGVDTRELRVPVATYLYDQRVVPCLTEVRELGCSQHGAHSPYITPI